MRSITRSAVTLLAILSPILSPAVGASLGAQAPGSGTLLHVTPYAGYMVFGSFLQGPVGTSLTNKPGALYGAQVGMSLAPNLSLVGNIGTTSSSMQVGLPFLGGLSVGSSDVLLYDADLEYDFGSSSGGALPFTPFVQAGVGQMRYDINASVIETHATNVTENVGLGADFTLGRGMALRVLAKDYIGKFNFQDATGLGITGNTAHNIGLSAGLRFDF